VKRIAIVILSLVTLAPCSEAQQPPGRIDIVQIYFSFLASRVAALSCDAVDKATEPKFQSNLLTVTIRATQALKERNQNLSEADLSAKIIAAQNSTQAAVKSEIAQNGCASDRIKELLKLYKVDSEVSLGG
jgi:hypothetical protein